jgi:3-dehydroquinate synthetase/shikimate kinase
MKDKIFLYGSPGSGKTTLGKVLSAALGVQFVDLDEHIESRASCSVREIFERFGEGYFRELETQCLEEICSQDSRLLVSLGGGTLLKESNRCLCESKGSVLLLETPSEEELARRLGKDPLSRPLGNKAKERESHYASFDKIISASFQLKDSLVLVGTFLADVFLGKNVVIDETVRILYPKLSDDIIATVPSGEAYKNIETIQRLWSGFNSYLISRQNVISAVGGGVTLDLTGFAAATWMRGVDWMNFPTTLLSMIDASTGGKTGCDLPEGKNLIGAFHSPKLVVIDTVFLDSLNDEHIKEGIAEIIKHEIISGDVILKSSLRPNAQEIAKALKVKVDIVNEDPYEKKSLRALLNCGHTVAHAIEVLSDFKISHGRAVAVGCVCESKIAVKMGLAKFTFAKELEERFAKFGIDTSLPPDIEIDKMKRYMLNDKKRDGNLVNFALPCSWGDVRMVKINPMEIEQW